MGDPLDNLVIGQFLFRLGVDLGRRAGAAPLACSNLLQQVAPQQALHQVFVESTGVVRLFEFRRSALPTISEYRRYRILHAALRRQPELRVLSRRLHWAVEPSVRVDTVDGASGPACAFDFSAGPYLDGPEADGPRFGLEEMIEGIVDDVLDPRAGDDGRLIGNYLDAVALFTGRAGAAAGLLLVIDARHGIRWVGLDDLCHLRESPERLLGRARRSRAAPSPCPDADTAPPTLDTPLLVAKAVPALTSAS